jgi:hypothetical protein
MVCNIQNHWFSGLCPSSGILNTRKMFRLLDLLSSLGDGREKLTLLGLLERADLNHWTID